MTLAEADSTINGLADVARKLETRPCRWRTDCECPGCLVHKAVVRAWCVAERVRQVLRVQEESHAV